MWQLCEKKNCWLKSQYLKIIKYRITLQIIKQTFSDPNVSEYNTTFKKNVILLMYIEKQNCLSNKSN